MTVSQLIKILVGYNPDDLVMVDGYEYGLVSEINIYPTHVVLDANSPDGCGGPHEEASYETKTHAVIISRK